MRIAPLLPAILLTAAATLTLAQTPTTPLSADIPKLVAAFAKAVGYRDLAYSTTVAVEGNRFVCQVEVREGRVVSLYCQADAGCWPVPMPQLTPSLP